jgi:hypothetical protein
LGLKCAAELQDRVGHRLDRRARAAERGHDDKFSLAQRRQPGLEPDGDRPFRPQAGRLRANAKAAQNRAD